MGPAPAICQQCLDLCRGIVPEGLFTLYYFVGQMVAHHESAMLAKARGLRDSGRFDIPWSMELVVSRDT